MVRLRLATVAVLAALALSLGLGEQRAAAQLSLAAGEPRELFETANFLANLNRPNDLALLPDGRAVVVSRGGQITVRTTDGAVVREAATLPVRPENNDNEQGLLGVVAHPDFAQNNTLFFYASLGDTVANKNQIVRATLSPENRFTIDFANPLLTLEGPHKHNGSMMIIHRGQLYLAVGDSGSQAPIPRNKYASCLNKANGSILRINLDGSVPQDNPLASLDSVTGCTTQNRLTGDFSTLPPEKRIVAWGLRNPYRFWIDPHTDLFWIGDVGEKKREELSVGAMGTHFGYPFEEGTFKWTPNDQPFNTIGGCAGMTPSRPCTPPVFEYTTQTSATADNSIIGGLIPQGCGWQPPFTGRYLFGDHGSGRIWTLDVTADRRGVVADSRRDFGTVRGLSGFRLGPDGTLYVISDGANAIARVWPKARDSSPATACPAASPPDASAPAPGPDPDPEDAGPKDPDPPAGGAGGDSGAGGASAGTGGGAGGQSGQAGQGEPTRGGGAAGSGNGGGQAGSSGDDPAERGQTAPGGCGCRLGQLPAQQDQGPALFLGLLGLAAFGWHSANRRRRR